MVKHNGFSITELVIAFAALILLAILGWYIFGNPSSQNRPSSKGLETFQNSVYTFSYPSGWAVDTPSPASRDSTLLSPRYDPATGARIVITATNEPNFKGVDTIVSENNSSGQSGIRNTEKLVVSGVEAVKFALINGAETDHITLVHQNGVSFQISYMYKTSSDMQKYKSSYDTVVSSFKLINLNN